MTISFDVDAKNMAFVTIFDATDETSNWLAGAMMGTPVAYRKYLMPPLGQRYIHQLMELDKNLTAERVELINKVADLHDNGYDFVLFQLDMLPYPQTEDK